MTFLHVMFFPLTLAKFSWAIVKYFLQTLIQSICPWGCRSRCVFSTKNLTHGKNISLELSYFDHLFSIWKRTTFHELWWILNFKIIKISEAVINVFIIPNGGIFLMFISDVTTKFNQISESNTTGKKSSSFKWKIKWSKSDYCTRHKSFSCKPVFFSSHWNDVNCSKITYI